MADRLDLSLDSKNFSPYDDYYLVQWEETKHSEILHGNMNEHDRRNVGRWAKVLRVPANFTPRGELVYRGDRILIEKHKGYDLDYLGFPKGYMVVRYKRIMAKDG